MADSTLLIFYKMKQVISMGGIMWEGLNSSLIKVDEALLKQQIRVEMRNKKKRGKTGKYIYSHHHRSRHHHHH